MQENNSKYDNFNPRSHERSDIYRSYNQQMIKISIHAPTRGATLIEHIYHNHMVFQSTLPREERQTSIIIIPICFYFNPRSHERSDYF